MKSSSECAGSDLPLTYGSNEYLDNENDSYETEQEEFWRAVFKKLICSNEMIEEYLEDKKHLLERRHRNR